MYHDREDIRVEDVPSAPVDPGDVRINIDACGICGSDLHEYAAGPIFVSEPRPARRERAIDCGADTVIDPTETEAAECVASNTDGGADVAFEVAGVEASFNDAVASTAPGGRTTVVSIREEAVSTHPNELVLAERTVTGTLAYLGGPRSAEEYGMVIELLGDDRLDPDPFITGRIGLGEIVEDGFERLLDPERDHVKYSSDRTSDASAAV